LQTKEYRIKLIANNREHQKVRREVEKLYKKLLSQLDGEIEFYIQKQKNPKYWGNVLYGLGSRASLKSVK